MRKEIALGYDMVGNESAFSLLPRDTRLPLRREVEEVCFAKYVVGRVDIAKSPGEAKLKPYP